MRFLQQFVVGKILFNVNLSMSVSENQDFFVRTRKHLAHDCMDAGGRATQEAKAENRSV
jgi:hypothetical protein